MAWAPPWYLQVVVRKTGWIDGCRIAYCWELRNGKPHVFNIELDTSEPPRRGRPRNPEIVYARLSALYAAFIHNQNSRHPIADIVNFYAEGNPPQTLTREWVADQIRRAREYGFLTPLPEHETVGGEITNKTGEVLANHLHADPEEARFSQLPLE
jgi:hypothetical protein